MRADQQRGRAGHRAERERLRHVPDERAIERVRNRSVANLVAVGFAPGAETRMKAVVDVFHGDHSHVRGKVRVQSLRQCSGLMGECHTRACNLTEGMNARVRASGAVRRHRAALES